MDEKLLIKNLIKYEKLAKEIIIEQEDSMSVSTKSSNSDLVTSVDKFVEKRINSEIRIDYPDAKIVSEEFNADDVDDLAGLVFFVDPIDGTANFVLQHDFFASMIGVYFDGEPFAGIIQDFGRENIYYGSKNTDIFKNEQKLPQVTDKKLSEGLISVGSRFILSQQPAIKKIIEESMGVRIYGSAGIEFVQLLEGKQIGYFSHLMPWDLAAGRFLVEKMGMIVTTIDGSPLNMLKSKNVIISTKQLHENAIKHLHDNL